MRKKQDQNEKLLLALYAKLGEKVPQELDCLEDLFAQGTGSSHVVSQPVEDNGNNNNNGRSNNGRNNSCDGNNTSSLNANGGSNNGGNKNCDGCNTSSFYASMMLADTTSLTGHARWGKAFGYIDPGVLSLCFGYVVYMVLDLDGAGDSKS